MHNVYFMGLDYLPDELDKIEIIAPGEIKSIHLDTGFPQFIYQWAVAHQQGPGFKLRPIEETGGIVHNRLGSSDTDSLDYLKYPDLLQSDSLDFRSSLT
jgi:hypothetical protein